MSEHIYPGRYTASSAEEFVLFRIGMRFNGWRGIVPAMRSFFAMPGMLAEQQANPEIGMLWTSAALSWPVVHVTQVWRSFDDLERYATAREGTHARTWRWFNRLGRSGHGTGIWHETFRIAPQTFEAIYVNMPRYGIAAATSHEPVVPAKSSARRRLAGSVTTSA